MNELSFLKVPSIAAAGQKIEHVSTPALLLDLDAFESNLREMAKLVQNHQVALRPHAKAHKRR